MVSMRSYQPDPVSGDTFGSHDAMVVLNQVPNTTSVFGFSNLFSPVFSKGTC